MLSTNVFYPLIQTKYVGTVIASYSQLRGNSPYHFSLDSVSYNNRAPINTESKGGKIGMAQSATKPNSARVCK
jgi:hypothetical protein